MTIKLIPGTPAVTKVVTPAKEATLSVELTFKEFAEVRALLGQVRFGHSSLFDHFDVAMRTHSIPPVKVKDGHDIAPITFINA